MRIKIIRIIEILIRIALLIGLLCSLNYLKYLEKVSLLFIITLIGIDVLILFGDDVFEKNFNGIYQEHETEMDKKGKPNFFLELIFNQKTLLFAFTILFFFIFKESITKLIINNLVDIIFSKAQINLAGFIVISGLISVYLIHKVCINYTTSFPQLYFFSLIFGIYVYYRLCTNQYKFVSLWGCIKYADFVLLLAIYPVFNFFSWFCRDYYPENNTISTFKGDNPISKEQINKEDGRYRIAKDLSEQILAHNEDKSFTIGIEGAWGSGKTTFITMLEMALEELKQKDIIVIYYNPFYNSDKKSIINDFFQSVIKVTRKYNADLTSKFEEYAKYLVEQSDNKILKTFHGLYNLISNDKVQTAKDQYEKIEKALKTLNKQFVIFIDDLDRMDKEEIIEILKIVRNTANFPNTVYLIPFDNDYVIKTLDKGTDFIDKFFQYKLVLPPLEPKVLEKIFLERINQPKLNDKHSQAFRDTISTFREVYRLSNNFMLEYSLLKGEVEVNDFILVLVLKLKYKNVYDELLINWNDYVRMRRIVMVKGEGEGKSEYAIIEKLKENKDFEKLNESHLINIKCILAELFSKDNINYNSPLFKFEEHTWNYFELKVSNKSISTTVLKDIENNPNVFIKEYQKFTEDKKDLWLVRLKRIFETITSKEDIEKYVNLWSELAKVEKDYDKIGKTFQDLFIKNETNPEIVDIMYKVLEKAQAPFELEGKITASLITTSSITANLSIDLTEKLKDLLFFFNEKYCSQRDRIVSSLYEDPQNKNYLKTRIIGDCETFIIKRIEAGDFYSQKSETNFILFVFGSYDEFKDFVDRQNLDKNLKNEFNKFYSIAEILGFTQNFIFEFKHINPIYRRASEKTNQIQIFIRFINEEFYEYLISKLPQPNETQFIRKGSWVHLLWKQDNTIVTKFNNLINEWKEELRNFKPEESENIKVGKLEEGQPLLMIGEETIAEVFSIQPKSIIAEIEKASTN